MVWYSHLLKNFPQFVVIHTVKGFGVVNKAEVDVFLELPWFFDNPDDDMKVTFYLSEIGSAMAATDVIEINWKTCANRFILSGSAGALVKEATAGKYIIPTSAYRDEGMSYHYAPPSDYISIAKADYLAEFFSKNHLPFVKGKVWTTDALYMETRELVRQRKADGCIAVEMELAGVQAVCNYLGLELYDFLVTGDIVDQQVYSPDGLIEANHSFDKFDIAVMIAKSIMRGTEYGMGRISLLAVRPGRRLRSSPAVQ